MDRRPAILLALLLPVAAVGCHAGPANNLAKPAPAPTREAVSKERFIALHNRNARAIRSLDASPQIEFSTGERRGSVRGKMALERPHNFQLNIFATGRTEIANIGSNDQGFWFWIKDNEERELYTCSYENVDASPLAATFQPDWIIESLGLRVIEPAEAKVISARPGDRPGVLILTQLRKDGRGEMLTKETVVDERDGKILEHRLYRGAKAQLLARATIARYQTKAMGDSADPAKVTEIHYPSEYRLEWVEEKLSLDITMDNPTINLTFPASRLASLFHEPQKHGYKRVDLATLGGTERATAPAPSSRIHETRPAPRSGSGVRLGEPQPLGIDGAMRTSGEPLALRNDPDAGPSAARASGVVGAPIPRAVEPEAAASAPSGSNRFRAPIFGR